MVPDEDVEVLDSSGRVVRIIPGREALEDVAAQKEADAARVEAANRDHTLLATYLSVADIERLMKQGMAEVVPGMNVQVETVVTRCKGCAIDAEHDAQIKHRRIGIDSNPVPL